MKWEYAELEVTFGKGGAALDWKCWYYSADGKHREESAPAGYGAKIASLGLDGWEAIGSNVRTGPSIVLIGGGYLVNYFFRRPMG